MRAAWEIFRREIKAYFQSPVAYVFLIVYLMLIGFLTFLVERYYENGQADLRPFFFWYPFAYLLLVPAVSMPLWAEERRSGTIELLLTLPVTTFQAILGKFMAAWAFLGLALALTFPVAVTTAWLGDPDTGVIIGGYVGSFMLAGAFLSVGMFTSAMTRNQVISFVLSLVLCLLLVLMGFSPVTDMFVRWAPAWLVDAVAGFSVMPHHESFQRGLLDIRDFGYYVSVIVVMFTATHVMIENRKAA